MPKRTISPLESFRNEMVKKYGSTVTRHEERVQRAVISSGSITLDTALRIGGWPVGRLAEIVGKEGTGKTSLSICSMREAQKAYPDRAVCYIDMEQTFDDIWAESLGLDTSDDRFLHQYANSSEHASDLLAKASDTQNFSMIVVDSIGGMESEIAFNKEAGESTMGKNAQIVTRMVKRIAVRARMNNIAVLLINQFRANFSPMAMTDVSAGPKAMKYATTVRVDTRTGGDKPLAIGTGDDKEIVGYQFKAKVSRNKLAPAGRTAEFWIVNQESDQFGPIGIDQVDEAVTMGVRANVVIRNGAFYRLPWWGEKETAQGRDAFKAVLRKQPEDIVQLREAVLKVAGQPFMESEVTYVTDGESA